MSVKKIRWIYRLACFVVLLSNLSVFSLDRDVDQKSLTADRALRLDGQIATLLIGINYTGTSNELQNCIYDTQHVVERLLIPVLGVGLDDLVIMNDYQYGTDLYPTAKNIRQQIDLFVEKANRTKRGFFQYSGHGSYIRDRNNDEKDRRDEVLCPIDYEEEGFIDDDELFLRVVKRLNSDVQLIVLCDSCFSGTIFDLPYTYDKKGKMKVDHKLSQTMLARLPQIVLISGSKDNQTSADGAVLSGSSTGSGAMTAAFLETLKQADYHISYGELIKQMNTWLKSQGFTQEPMLSSTHRLSLKKEYLESFIVPRLVVAEP
jgi:metacaspase-1